MNETSVCQTQITRPPGPSRPRPARLVRAVALKRASGRDGLVLEGVLRSNKTGVGSDPLSGTITASNETKGNPHMRSTFRRALPALLAMLALSAVGATVAQAAEGPFYKVAGARLKAGETREVKAKAAKSYVMTIKTFKISITCKSQSVLAGAKIIGSTGANAGTGEETIEFSGCTVSGNGTPCELEHGKFTTKPLKKDLVYANSERTGKILVLFKPVVGGERAELAFLKFVGTGCKEKEVALEGSLAAEDFSGGKAVEIGKEAVESTTNGFNFPEVTIKEVFEEKEGKLEEKKVSLTAFGFAFALEGRSELTLAGEPSWEVFTK